MVLTPASQYSSSPLASVKVRTSKIRSSFLIPWRLMARSMILSATSSLFGTVLAIPISSIVRQTKLAPYFLARLHTSSNLGSPSSRLTELRIGFPPIFFKAVSRPVVCVESGIRGSAIFWLYIPITAFISFVSSRPAKPTFTSITCAPARTCCCATLKVPS